MYEESIGRELSLIYEIDELKQTIKQLLAIRYQVFLESHKPNWFAVIKVILAF